MNVIKKSKEMANHGKNLISKIVRPYYLAKKKKRFTNRTLSLFSSNCVGGCMLHDLGARFNSPFVNLYLNAEDYLKFLSQPQKYTALEFEELQTEHPYPVAVWGDLTVYFVHYKTYEEAVCAFKRRLARINYENLFVLFVERDGCTYEQLKQFDALPYAHKVVFTHQPYPEIPSAVYIEGYEKEPCLGDVMKWDTPIGRKVYDRFDYVSWLNG